MSSNLTLLARFEAKYASSSDPNECWPWLGSIDAGTGYGKIWHEGKSKLAHRVAYELYVGPIPEGMTIDHECHNTDDTCAGGITCAHRACVNVSHLVVATKRVNILSGKTIPAANAVKTQCIHGHPFSPENTKVMYDKRGGRYRVCRECARLRHQSRVRVRVA